MMANKSNMTEKTALISLKNPSKAQRGSSMPHVRTVQKHLKKSIGLFQALCYVFGLLFGSGVFTSPGLVAKQTNSMGLALLVWIISGTICVFGALCFCELAIALKKTGGEYIFIKEAYGDVAAFCLIWTQTFVIFPTCFTGILATIGEYCISPFFDTSSSNRAWLIKLTAIFCIFLALLINGVSTSFVGKAQVVFSAVQVVALVFFLIIGIWKISTGNTQNYSKLFEGDKPFDAASLSLAFYNCLWSYEGWGFICKMTEEMRNPSRDLRMSIILGIPFVVVCFVLINLSFMSVMTHEEIGQTIIVPKVFIERSLGKEFSFIASILCLISGFSSINSVLCLTSRSILSAARESHLPEPLSYIHRDRRTPIPAMTLTFLLSTIWILAAGDEIQSLLVYFSFAIWLTYSAAIFAVVILRIRQPNLPRPIKVWIINPIFMTLVSLYLVIAPFAKQPIESSICLLFILMALPAYYLLIRDHKCLPSFCEDFKRCCYLRIRTSLNLVPCVYEEDPTLE